MQGKYAGKMRCYSPAPPGRLTSSPSSTHDLNARSRNFIRPHAMAHSFLPGHLFQSSRRPRVYVARFQKSQQATQGLCCPLRTSVRPSAGFSVPGSPYAISNSPSSNARWILKERRAEYFSPHIFFGFRRERRLPQSANARYPDPDRRRAKNASAATYDPPSH